MRTYGERLKYALHCKGVNQSELAEAVGVKPQSIQYLCKQGTKSTLTNAIARHLGISADWLDAGRGDMIAKITMATTLVIENESNAHETFPLGKFRPVPVVGHAQLGDNGHWAEMEYPVGYGDGCIPFPIADDNAYALRCMGDSMRPRIQSGEYVIIAPNTEPVSGDEVLIKAQDGRVMIKRFLYMRDGRMHVMSINESHPPQSFALEEILKFHTVAAIVKPSMFVKDCS